MDGGGEILVKAVNKWSRYGIRHEDVHAYMLSNASKVRQHVQSVQDKRMSGTKQTRSHKEKINGSRLLAACVQHKLYTPATLGL